MPNQVRSNNLMNHHIALVVAGSREEFFRQYLKGKRVLHVGCTDYPRFDPNRNLHIALSRCGLAALHGLDIDAAGIEALRAYVKEPLYTSFEQLTESYDVVLVPEVLEHVLNAGEFLRQVMAVRTAEILVLAPNAVDIVMCNPGMFGWFQVKGERLYRETVHADHCCYYSPMTLLTTLRKAIAAYAPGGWTLGLLFVAGVSVGCAMRRIAVGSGQVGASGDRSCLS